MGEVDGDRRVHQRKRVRAQDVAGMREGHSGWGSAWAVAENILGGAARAGAGVGRWSGRLYCEEDDLLQEFGGEGEKRHW